MNKKKKMVFDRGLDTICYVGETEDYSDQWLVDMIGRHFKVLVFKPGDLLPMIENSVFINRLYGSALSRHGIENIDRTLDMLRALEDVGVPIINSVRGYILEANRIEQHRVFLEKGIKFVPTVYVGTINKNFPKPPYVLKDSLVFRNKNLRIIRHMADLNDLSLRVKEKSLLQPLINSDTCYRTEFIGDSSVTFLQSVNIMKDSLSFQHTGKIISTPLEESILNKLMSFSRSIRVQVFSIEYFLDEEHSPIIVDFNINSNYKPFFLKEAGGMVEKSWINLLKKYDVFK